MRFLNNSMASYEVKVAAYYYRRGAFVAAANRAQGALVNFPQTPANERALDLLRASYTRLGMTTLAEDTQQILTRTFPDSRYVTGATDVAWWQVWKKEEEQFGIQATGQMAQRPWWQFW
jgi:outer membrane protein assembly factor BamD